MPSNPRTSSLKEFIEVSNFDLAELDPGVAEQFRKFLTSPEYQRQALEAEAEVARRDAKYRGNPVRFGLIDGPLPDGAIAVVVRMATGPARRLMVFSAGSVDDRAISLARHGLREDEDAMPDSHTLRMLRIWSDQRVAGPGAVKQMRYDIPATVNGDAALLLRRIARGVVDVPVLGRVQLVDDIS